MNKHQYLVSALKKKKTGNPFPAYVPGYEIYVSVARA